LRRHIFGYGNLMNKVNIYKRCSRGFYMVENLAFGAVMVFAFVVMVVGNRY